jgi:amphi-Trp domain-containing protein
MKQSRNEVILEAAVPVPQVVEYLEQLVAALKSGAVHVHVGSQEIVLGPRGVLGFELRARQKGKRQKLALELSWRKKLVAPDESLELAFRSASSEVAPEAIEVVDLETAETAEAASAGTAADVGAEKGEAHEGEATSTSAGSDVPAA